MRQHITKKPLVPWVLSICSSSAIGYKLLCSSMRWAASVSVFRDRPVCVLVGRSAVHAQGHVGETCCPDGYFDYKTLIR